MIDWIKSLFEPTDDTASAVDGELRLILQESLRECEALYRTSARIALQECPDKLPKPRRKFQPMMIDLHRGLMIKILIEIGRCDRIWDLAERELAKMVLRHAWGVDVTEQNLATALRNVADHAETLDWDSLVRPFVTLEPLHEEIPELTALSLRIAQLIAKADGHISVEEQRALRNIERGLEDALDKRTNGRETDGQDQDLKGKIPGIDSIAQAVAFENRKKEERNQQSLSGDAKQETPLSEEEREKMLQEAFDELNDLIGLEVVKKEIRELADFIKMQGHRRDHQLPTTAISLHSIFSGNPGTGKTTVARILGRVFCGLGMLSKGHTVETDRSGLVAQYAGQTGPRTHERVNEALDGVLFIDEAYSLIAEHGTDQFGVVAVQTMLKRMEDDRDRLAVVLAGYPHPMEQLLESNPGLSSRFQRTFRFPDYSAKELLKIFRAMCFKNHYRLTESAKKKVFLGFQSRIEQKDDRFGNGRLARNVFERAIRRQASRLVEVAPLSRKLLITLEADDIELAESEKSVS